MLVLMFFSDLTPKTRATKAMIAECNYIKLKSFSTTKQTINEMRRQSTAWEKIFVNDLTNKGLIYKMYHKLLQPVTN